MELFLIFLFCLASSAFFSGAEMAFVSANTLQFREMADSGNLPARKILKLQENPQEFLTVILIGNNIVNITATAVMTYWLEVFFGMESEWLVAAIMAPLLIIGCEIVPKDYGRLRSQGFLLQYAGLLDVMLKACRFPVRLILRGIDLFLGPLGVAIDRSIFVSEKEFRLLIEESVKTGVLAAHEKKLVDTIMDFERIPVESVMTPLEKVQKADITETIGKVKQIARQTNVRMVLVSEEIPTLIVGMIYVFDILFEPNDEEGFKKYLRSPIFLPRKTTIEKAFLTLQEKRQSFAVVTDDAGEVIGAVAIEKLFTF